ncbi:hypothetical protein HDU96_006806 [Phlyctochytrium bullatum]|nr:hypothetical protein HDU96_006806 [Phlyctochytrium bullatum]
MLNSKQQPLLASLKTLLFSKHSSPSTSSTFSASASPATTARPSTSSFRRNSPLPSTTTNPTDDTRRLSSDSISSVIILASPAPPNSTSQFFDTTTATALTDTPCPGCGIHTGWNKPCPCSVEEQRRQSEQIWEEFGRRTWEDVAAAVTESKRGNRDRVASAGSSTLCLADSFGVIPSADLAKKPSAASLPNPTSNPTIPAPPHSASAPPSILKKPSTTSLTPPSVDPTPAPADPDADSPKSSLSIEKRLEAQVASLQSVLTRIKQTQKAKTESLLKATLERPIPAMAKSASVDARFVAPAPAVAWRDVEIPTTRDPVAPPVLARSKSLAPAPATPPPQPTQPFSVSRDPPKPRRPAAPAPPPKRDDHTASPRSSFGFPPRTTPTPKPRTGFWFWGGFAAKDRSSPAPKPVSVSAPPPPPPPAPIVVPDAPSRPAPPPITSPVRPTPPSSRPPSVDAFPAPDAVTLASKPSLATLRSVHTVVAPADAPLPVHKEYVSVASVGPPAGAPAVGWRAGSPIPKVEPSETGSEWAEGVIRGMAGGPGPGAGVGVKGTRGRKRDTAASDSTVFLAAGEMLAQAGSLEELLGRMKEMW